jgi:alcohol dehydrogenase (cytochrome c)
MYNPFYRPGDNLYTNSLISWDPDTGKMNWPYMEAINWTKGIDQKTGLPIDYDPRHLAEGRGSSTSRPGRRATK